MIIREKLGRLADVEINGRTIDWLPVEWHETGKRILHKRTETGVELTLKFLNSAPNLQQNDVLFVDDRLIITVCIMPCEVIIIKPVTMYQMAAVCYEIGNKHLPLFYETDQLLIPYDAPVFNMLQAAGFDSTRAVKQLLQPLKTSVLAHEHRSNESLFYKILKRTTT